MRPLAEDERLRREQAPLRASPRALLSAPGLVALDARILLAHALGCERAWLAAHVDEALDEASVRAYQRLAARRRAGEPVAYIVGRREFFSLEFAITPQVLIPRPETELLVELALARLAPGQPCRVLDVGTGAGAVAIALARQRPLAQVTGVDVVPEAVELARANAARLGVRNVSFRPSDWFGGLAGERFDLIVANPPYVVAADPHLQQGDLRFEPRIALCGGPDGLVALRHIIAESPPFLDGGELLVEHGYDQAGAVRMLFAAAGFAGIDTARDLAGIERVTHGRAAETSPAAA